MNRQKWILIAIGAIIGSTFLIDYFVSTKYPEELLVITRIPDLKVGTEYTYIFFRNEENLGNHSYSIKNKNQSGSSTTYTIDTSINLISEGKTLDLSGRYTFNQDFTPIHYQLNASEHGDITIITCEFNNGRVNTSVDVQGEVITMSEEIKPDTLLIENTMPAYWEILFQSTSLKQGRRYKAEVFIPQANRVVSISLFVDTKKIQVDLGEETVEATVVKLSDLNLIFYLYRDELIVYRDDAQGLLLRKVT